MEMAVSAASMPNTSSDPRPLWPVRPYATPIAAMAPPPRMSATSSEVSAPSSLPPLPTKATAANATASAVLAAQDALRDTAHERGLLAGSEKCGDDCEHEQRGDGGHERRRH